MKPGTLVRHKKDKSLIQGRVLEMAQSKIRVRVEWDKKNNPRLIWSLSAYYRLDLLEEIEKE